MRRFVENPWGMGTLVAILTLAVIVPTGAGRGATYLIALGFCVIAIGIVWGPERLDLWRTEHRRSSARHPTR